MAFIAIPIQWTALEFQSSGYIKVRARLDEGEEIKLGALRVAFADGKTAENADDETAERNAL